MTLYGILPILRKEFQKNYNSSDDINTAISDV